MNVALGSDLKNEVTAAIEEWLADAGHTVMLYGALSPNDSADWPRVGRAVGEAVAKAQAQCGIVCCWTGTGVSIAANKVPGVRAALCADAQTADGARTWNDANVLAIGLRSMSIPVAQEILAAWFGGAPTQDPTYRAMIADAGP